MCVYFYLLLYYFGTFTCTTLKICADKYLNMFSLLETERQAHPEIVYNDLLRLKQTTKTIPLRRVCVSQDNVLERSSKSLKQNRGWMRQRSIYIPA